MRERKIRVLLLTVIWVFVLMNLVFFTGAARCEYPERPVTIIVGNEPGGVLDVITRVLVAGAEKYLGQAIVIENKGGAGGTVALSVVTAAKPDGYTLCSVASTAIVNAPLMQKVTFKPLKSFTPVNAFAAPEHQALIVKNDTPWKTFKEFIDYAKKNPGKIKYSTAGLGTSMHVAMEVIAQKEGIKWVHIPYKGNAPAVTALLGGHVVVCSVGVDFPPYVQSGAARVLATYGGKRSPNFPNVPTLKELGYDFVTETMHSIVGPAGVPPGVVRTLETAFTKGIETLEFKATLERLYVTPVYYNSQDYDRFLKGYWVRAEKTLRDSGIIKESATQPY